jgi:hypothetical protein
MGGYNNVIVFRATFTPDVSCFNGDKFIMKMIGKLVGIMIGLIVIGFLLIQLVPYGRNHTNPSVTQEPAWDTSQTRELAKRACFDYHSNETTWPWYSNIAPVSWLVYRDVAEGRRRLNFSEWNRPRFRSDEIVAIVLEGEMPPSFYLPLHPSARLTASEKQLLVNGLTATLGNQ